MYGGWVEQEKLTSEPDLAFILPSHGPWCRVCLVIWICHWEFSFFLLVSICWIKSLHMVPNNAAGSPKTHYAFMSNLSSVKCHIYLNRYNDCNSLDIIKSFLFQSKPHLHVSLISYNWEFCFKSLDHCIRHFSVVKRC